MAKIANNVWKFSGNTEVYLIDLGKKILVDAGISDEKELLLEQMKRDGFKPDDVNAVIMTHMHYDHLGNFDLFKNAIFYAGSKEIKAFNEDGFGTVLNKKVCDEFKKSLKEKKIALKDISELKMPELEIINTPGHTSGSICIFYANEGILFSGDTLFRGCHGRTDLPTSAPSEIQKSLSKLLKYNYKKLCPGHDY